MTAATVAPARVAAPAHEGVGDRVRAWCHDAVVLTRRNLVHIRREPAQLSDVTVQPVLFTLMFIYVIGGALVLPGGGNYKDFAIAGLMTLNLTTMSMGTAVGISTDMTTGVIDRFGTLPMSRSAVLVGRTFADLGAAAICIAIVAITGLCIGWRTDASALSVMAGFGVALLFGYALSWGNAVLGILSKGPESAQAVGLVILFPLAFVSNAFVPTQGMPAWLGQIAAWNPVSAVAASVRELFGNPNPSASISAWPMQHPTWAALLWSLAILAVAAPLASRLYRKRTTD